MENKLIDKIFSNYSDVYSHLFDLSAIHMKMGASMRRVKKDDKVRVSEGTIVGFQNPTHIVTRCRGTLTDSVLELTLQDLKSNEIITLNV